MQTENREIDRDRDANNKFQKCCSYTCYVSENQECETKKRARIYTRKTLSEQFGWNAGLEGTGHKQLR